MEAPAEAPILRRLLALNGQADPDRSVMFATDAGWFQEMGMECAIWGPGSIEVAHKPNERLDRGELERARGLLDSLVRNALLEAA
jgi:acetylornithine deacetylase